MGMRELGLTERLRVEAWEAADWWLRSLRELAVDSDGDGQGERLERDGLGDGLGETGPGETAVCDRL